MNVFMKMFSLKMMRFRYNMVIKHNDYVKIHYMITIIRCPRKRMCIPKAECSVTKRLLTPVTSISTCLIMYLCIFQREGSMAEQ